MIKNKATHSFFIKFIIVVFLVSPPSFARKVGLEKAGDYSANLLPALSVIIPLASEDWNKSLITLKSLSLASGVVHVGKYLAGKKRPNYDVEHGKYSEGSSFPSGHTQAAFSGASLLHYHYGPKVGVPAYLLAVFTGYSRIVADKHYLDDVVAGASIGLFSTLLFTDNSTHRVLPYFDRDNLGFNLEINDNLSYQSQSKYTLRILNSYFSFSGKFNESSSEIDSRTNELVSARLKIDHFYKKNKKLNLNISPFEFKTRATFNSLQGVVEFESYDIGFAILSKLKQSEDLELYLGGGLVFRTYDTSFYDAKNLLFEQNDTSVLPSVNTQVNLDISKTVSVVIEGILSTDLRFYNYEYSLHINKEIGKSWSSSLGLVKEVRSFSKDNYINKLEIVGPFLDLGYRF